MRREIEEISRVVDSLRPDVVDSAVARLVEDVSVDLALPPAAAETLRQYAGACGVAQMVGVLVYEAPAIRPPNYLIEPVGADVAASYGFDSQDEPRVRVSDAEIGALYEFGKFTSGPGRAALGSFYTLIIHELAHHLEFAYGLHPLIAGWAREYLLRPRYPGDPYRSGGYAARQYTHGGIGAEAFSMALETLAGRAWKAAWHRPGSTADPAGVLYDLMYVEPWHADLLAEIALPAALSVLGVWGLDSQPADPFGLLRPYLDTAGMVRALTEGRP